MKGAVSDLDGEVAVEAPLLAEGDVDVRRPRYVAVSQPLPLCPLCRLRPLRRRRRCIQRRKLWRSLLSRYLPPVSSPAAKGALGS